MILLIEVRPSVSVLICVKNAEKYIYQCIESILQQTFSNFELVIVDDLSDDQTGNIINSFKDYRIKYFRNQQWLGISKSRNICLKHANGEYLFFTDGDCIAYKNWIEEGLKYLKGSDYVGVEGKTYYVSANYQPTFSDHWCESRPGDFMTGNIAYKRSVVTKVGGFDERYDYNEDRDFGLRVVEFGHIRFNINMVVIVQKQILTPKDFIRRSNVIKNRVYLFKKFKDKRNVAWRLVEPFSFAMILFPPLIFASLLSNKFRTSEDFKLLPFKYLNLLCARLHLLKESAKERVFLF